MLEKFKLEKLIIDNANFKMPELMAKEGDIQGRGLHLVFLDGGLPLDLSQASIEYQAIHLNNNYSTWSAFTRVKNNEYMVLYPKEILKPGIVFHQIKITYGTNIIKSFIGKLIVEGDIVKSSSVAGTYNMEIIDQKLAELQNYNGRLSNLEYLIKDINPSGTANKIAIFGRDGKLTSDTHDYLILNKIQNTLSPDKPLVADYAGNITNLPDPITKLKGFDIYVSTSIVGSGHQINNYVKASKKLDVGTISSTLMESGYGYRSAYIPLGQLGITFVRPPRVMVQVACQDEPNDSYCWAGQVVNVGNTDLGKVMLFKFNSSSFLNITLNIFVEGEV